MTRFRVVFILLLALAMSTSVLAISGLVGSWEESGAYFGTSAASSTATTTVTASSSATVLSISASTTSASSIATTTNTVSSTVAQQGTSSSRNTVNDSLHAAYGASLSSLSSSANGSEVLVVTAQRSSLFLAPACWIAVLGAWILERQGPGALEGGRFQFRRLRTFHENEGWRHPDQTAQRSGSS